jgi:hypothetical protein
MTAFDPNSFANINELMSRHALHAGRKGSLLFRLWLPMLNSVAYFLQLSMLAIVPQIAARRSARRL